MNQSFQPLRSGAIALAIFAPLVYLALNWSAMPDRVPMHFGISGKPDGWGPRWTLFLLPVIAVALLSLLTVGKRFPSHFNYPVPVTPENRERQQQLGLELLDEMRLVTAVMLGYISIQQMRTALNLTNGLGVWTMLLFMASMIGTIAAYMIRSIRAR
jgi:uncharacterized membrane protein